MPAGADRATHRPHPHVTTGDESDFYDADDEPQADPDGDEWDSEADNAQVEPEGAPPRPAPKVPPKAQPEPAEQPLVHGGARGANSGSGRKLPSYLHGLCALPGVDREGFESVDCRTAVIELWCAQPRCNHDKLPVAHLAPDALAVLARMRFHGHVRFAVYARDTDREPAFNSAFEMPAEYAELAQPQAAGADDAYRVEYELRAELDQLKQQIANAPRGNPFAMFREMLAGIREAIHEVGEIRTELSELASLDMSSGEQNGEEGGGGTGEAVLAMLIDKGQQALESDTAKALIKWGREKLMGEKAA